MTTKNFAYIVQVFTILVLSYFSLNQELFNINWYFLFVYLLAMSFLNYKSVEKVNVIHISWISLMVSTSLYIDNFILEYIFIALAPFTLLVHSFNTNSLKMFRWIQSVGILIFGLSIWMFLIDESKLALIFAVIGVLIRQAQFPFHLWIHEVHLNREIFPSLTYLVLIQSGFVLYGHTMVHVFSNSNLDFLIPVITLVSGLICAFLALKEKDNLTKHFLIILSQSSLPLAAYHSFSTTTAVGGVIFAMVIAIGGMVFSFFAFHFVIQKEVVSLDRFYSMYRKNKNLAAIYFVSGFSLVGLPFTLGYIAEDILFHGLIQTATNLAPLYIFMAGINGYSVFYLFNRLFFGHSQENWSSLYQNKLNKFFIGIATILITFGILIVSPLSSKLENKIEKNLESYSNLKSTENVNFSKK